MPNTTQTGYPSVARTVTVGLLALAGLAPGCGRNPNLGPSPPRSFAPPVITALSESLGSTGGGAEVKIEGTGFLDLEGGAVVLFGGVRASRVSFMGATTIFATTPAHAAGLVDLVVSNPDGQSGRLANGYAYVSPDSFDANGEWEGKSRSRTDHLELRFRFTIQNSRLTAVFCDTSGTVSVSPAPSVSNGEFAFAREDGVAIVGRLVSARDAIGTINLAPCTNAEWSARKQP